MTDSSDRKRRDPASISHRFIGRRTSDVFNTSRLEHWWKTRTIDEKFAYYDQLDEREHERNAGSKWAVMILAGVIMWIVI